ncbi:MAG: tetratricopeptide repeat protein, partial [Acidisphaera sp.]|nr:tetratricopeptide repeat protein [Acidisphaera sp.]
MRAGDLKRAQIQLRNAVRDNPNSADAHLQLATVELRVGDPAAAEKDFRDALALGADPAAIKPALAQTYLLQQHFQELLSDFPAVESPPELAARIDVFRALAYVRLRKFTEAAEAIAAAEKLAPTLPDVPLTAAQIALARQDRVTAEREVDRTLDLDNRNISALMLKADLQRLRNDHDGAMRTVELAIADNPNVAQARITRAGFYLDDGRDADAKKDVDAVLAAEPQNVMATYLRGVLLTRAKDWNAADPVLTRIAPYSAQIPKSLYFTAIVKSNIGQPEQAHDDAARYVARVPEDLEGVKLLARIALNSKQPADAVRALNDTINAGRGDAETLDLLGRAYAMSDRPADAVQVFERAASLAPGNQDILTQLASARVELAAAPATDTPRPATPEQPGPTEASATAALASGDLGRAQVAITALQNKDGNTEAVADLSARLKMAQLDLAGARSQLEAALKQYPDSVRIRLALARLAEIQLQPDQIERWLGEVLQRQPANQQALGGMIAMMVGSGRVNRAITIADAARKAAPGNPALVGLVADLQIRAGDAQTAMATLNAVPKDMADAPAVLGARARVQVALNQRAEAEATYRRILAASPDDLNARARLIELLLADNDRPGAKQALADGLKHAPKNLGMMALTVKMAAEDGGLNAGLAQADAFIKDPATLPE